MEVRKEGARVRERGCLWGHLPAALLPIPQVWAPLRYPSLTAPPPTPHSNLTPFFFFNMCSCCTPPLTNHQTLFPKRIRFVLTGVGFQCYSKLSVILMISLRGRDRKMNRFSLSFPHNCEWASERDRVREAVHIDVCIREGFDWANIITRNEIKTVNESLFHCVTPIQPLFLLCPPFLFHSFIMLIPNLFYVISMPTPSPTLAPTKKCHMC